MNVKQIQIALVIIGLSSCLICAADDEAKLMKENPDWHITTEVYTNPPYWLMPTNVPARFTPLKNGQWVWTTNMELSDTSIVTDGQIDMDKLLHQVRPQVYQRIMNEIDPPGIAHVSEFRSAWHGKYHWETNMAVNWWGVWAEDTNSGWRVNLCPVKTNKTSAIIEAVIVKVGSVVTNSGAGLLPSPDGKYAKLELLAADGKVVPTKPGAAMKLYQEKYVVLTKDMIVNGHPPSSWDATVERNFPDTIQMWSIRVGMLATLFLLAFLEKEGLSNSPGL